MATFALLGAGGVQAALVENLTIGNPKALALGNAVTADPPGVDSIHFNPAGLTRVQGREGLFKVAVAYFNFRAEFGDYHPLAQAEIDKWGMGETDPVENSVSETDDIMVKVPFVEGRTEWPLPAIIVPTGGAAYRPAGKDYTIGTAVYAPMAAGYVREDDDPGSLMGKEMALTRLTYFSPTIGFKLNDEWSVGVGVHFSYQGISAYTDLRVQHILLGVVNNALDQLENGSDCLGGAFTFCEASVSPFEQAVTLEVDVETPLSVTASFGALWEPTPWFTWGFMYETETTNRMKGSYRMTYSDDWQAVFGAINRELGGLSSFLGLPTGLAEQHGDATIDLKTPAHFSTGISVRVLPDWKVNVDAKWTDWKVWQGLKIEYDQVQEFTAVAAALAPNYATPDTLTIPRHYESVWNLAFGVEHQYNDNVVLRFGYEPRNSSIPDDKQDVLLPIGDADLFTVGVGFDWRKNSHIDLAFGYYHAHADIPAGTSTNANSMDPYTNILYNPYSGLDIETDATAYLFESSFTWQF
ncbi:MAG TPA: outer membrane protein transport protein [Dongiaceae bacterium]|nr:outer membrane protein transport protein [Dongiaceae bacterium]